MGERWESGSGEQRKGRRPFTAGSVRLSMNGPQTLRGNPLLDVHGRTKGQVGPAGVSRDALIAQYGFAIPSTEALEAIERWSPKGLVEVGAGTGYWARLLADRGVDVLAYDIAPPPSVQNQWFAGSTPWYHVAPADATIAVRHPERTMLLIWPTLGDLWPLRALELFHAEGGTRLAYVGEGPGGRTGDDVFHALLGEIWTCTACRLGVSDTPCVCSTPALWQRVERVELPHWHGFTDDLYLYARRSPRRRRRWLRSLKRKA